MPRNQRNALWWFSGCPVSLRCWESSAAAAVGLSRCTARGLWDLETWANKPGLDGGGANRTPPGPNSMYCTDRPPHRLTASTSAFSAPLTEFPTSTSSGSFGSRASKCSAQRSTDRSIVDRSCDVQAQLWYDQGLMRWK